VNSWTCGPCANVMCAQYGCQRWRPNYSYPSYFPPNYPQYGHWNPPSYSAPLGCICPIGAEKTCEGLVCPRRGLRAASGIEAGTAIDSEAGVAEGESPVPQGDAQNPASRPTQGEIR
jgi:hypothetical protein